MVGLSRGPIQLYLHRSIRLTRPATVNRDTPDPQGGACAEGIPSTLRHCCVRCRENCKEASPCLCARLRGSETNHLRDASARRSIAGEIHSNALGHDGTIRAALRSAPRLLTI